MNQHLSVRVLWHDHGWEGTVCCNPGQNQACRILKNIAEYKKDGIEKEIAGNRVCKIGDYEIPCLSESGAFMSPQEVAIEVGHPYTFLGILFLSEIVTETQLLTLKKQRQ
jgi:hypothetical protein